MYVILLPIDFKMLLLSNNRATPIPVRSYRKATERLSLEIKGRMLKFRNTVIFRTARTILMMTMIMIVSLTFYTTEPLNQIRGKQSYRVMLGSSNSSSRSSNSSSCT